MDAVDEFADNWAKAGGGGGGGGGGGQSGEGGDGRGDEPEDEGDADAILAKNGLDAASLPDDLLEALRAGRIGAAEMANWAKVAASPLGRVLASLGFVRNRLIAEPRLLTILAIEISLGCICTVLADKAARGDKFLSELDFVLANQLLISLTNTALVLALCPVAPVVAAASGGAAASIAKLPGYFLQRGPFTAAQRAGCFAYKAAFFGAVGIGTSAAGQGATMGLVKMRGDDPKTPKVELAPLSETCAAFALFMVYSANTRYQLVNSFEGRLLNKFPAAAQTAIATTVRTLNNYLGSANWIWWAKLRGLQ